MRIKGDGVYTYVIETNTKQHLNVNIYGLLQQIVGLQRADLVIFKRGVPNQDKGVNPTICPHLNALIVQKRGF